MHWSRAGQERDVHLLMASSLRETFRSCRSPTCEWLSQKRMTRRAGSTLSQNRWTQRREPLKKSVAILFPELYKPRARSTRTLLVDPDLEKMEETNRQEFFWVKQNGSQLKRIWLFYSMNIWGATTDVAAPKPQQTSSHTIQYIFEGNHERKRLWKKCAKSIMGNVFLNKTLQSMEKCVFNYISS